MRNPLYLSLLVLLTLVFNILAWSILHIQTTLEGTIQNMQTDIITLTEKSEANPDQIVNIEINDETQYDQVASLDALNVGDIVEVKYKKIENKITATRISMVEKAQEASLVAKEILPGVDGLRAEALVTPVSAEPRY